VLLQQLEGFKVLPVVNPFCDFALELHRVRINRIFSKPEVLVLALALALSLALALALTVPCLRISSSEQKEIAQARITHLFTRSKPSRHSSKACASHYCGVSPQLFLLLLSAMGNTAQCAGTLWTREARKIIRGTNFEGELK
jgi:hypothetical protein